MFYHYTRLSKKEVINYLEEDFLSSSDSEADDSDKDPNYDIEDSNQNDIITTFLIK